MIRTTHFDYRSYNPRWLLGLLVAIAIGLVVGAVFVYLKQGILAALPFAAFAVLTAVLGRALRFFEVTLDEAGLRYGWAGFGQAFIPRAEIASVTVRRYPWIFGYGWRWAGRTVCYSIPFDRTALEVRRTRGFIRRYLFTVPAGDAVVAALAGIGA